MAGKTVGWAAAGAALLLSAGAARAATICVSPAGGACQTEIQAAVNLAGPGDTVRIGPGTYFGNINVPSGKDGLQIVGASRLTTVIDAYLPFGGYGISISSNNVQIRNLGFKNGQGIGVGANGVLLTGNRIVGGGSGISLSGAGHKVIGNEVRSVANIGISVSSADTLVQGNTILQAQTGIGVFAVAGTQLVSNRITDCRYAIDVQGATAPILTGNIVEQAGPSSIAVNIQAVSPVLRGNKLTNAWVRLRCTTCTGALAEGNSVKGSAFDGLFFLADGPGLVVRSNTVTGASSRAFVFVGTGIEASANEVTDSGAYSTNFGCFHVLGTNHTLTSNKAIRCRRSGFFVQADGATLVGNTSTGAVSYGFTVNGGGGIRANNTLTGNKADTSGAGGFAVVGGAVNTVLGANTGTKNRYDFCDQGTGTDTAAGNVFTSTSTVCDLVP
jgi:hypothetical protein